MIRQFIQTFGLVLRKGNTLHQSIAQLKLQFEAECQAREAGRSFTELSASHPIWEHM